MGRAASARVRATRAALGVVVGIRRRQDASAFSVGPGRSRPVHPGVARRGPRVDATSLGLSVLGGVGFTVVAADRRAGLRYGVGAGRPRAGLGILVGSGSWPPCSRRSCCGSATGTTGGGGGRGDRDDDADGIPDVYAKPDPGDRLLRPRTRVSAPSAPRADCPPQPPRGGPSDGTDHDATRPVPTDLRHSQERTIGQLVAQVTDDLRFIVRKEIELAKTEITSQLGIAGKGAGMLATAGVSRSTGSGCCSSRCRWSSRSGFRRGPGSSSWPWCFHRHRDPGPGRPERPEPGEPPPRPGDRPGPGDHGSREGLRERRRRPREGHPGPNAAGRARPAADASVSPAATLAARAPT